MGDVGVASMEHPESVSDSFIFSSAPEIEAGDKSETGDRSESLDDEEATAFLMRLASTSTTEPALDTTDRAAPRDMQEVEGLFNFSVLAPIRGNALRSAAAGGGDAAATAVVVVG